MRTLGALVLLGILAGCFTPSDSHLRNLVVAQRACEATPYTSLDGWWARRKWMAQCAGNSALPADCERPGTEGDPKCINWAAATAGGAEDQAAATAIAGSAGWAALGTALVK